MVSIQLAQQAENEKIFTLCVTQDQDIVSALKKSFGQYSEFVNHYAQEKKFCGGVGEILSLPIVHENETKTLLLVGLGKKDKNGHVAIEVIRRAIGLIVKYIQKHKNGICALSVDFELFQESKAYVIQHIVTVGMLAAYHFNEYITEEKRKRSQNITLHIITSEISSNLEEAVRDGIIIGKSVNQARYWIDMPPSDLTPPQLAQEAIEIAKKQQLKCTVFSEQEIIKMGMGGLAGVSAGSHQDCKLVVLEYKAKQSDAPTLAFVGKGITFDSGGLSLKPAQYMETMKEDMSGAAAVLSAMQAIAQLKPHVNVVGVAALSENLPSGTATKPGDIIKFYNGKTAEILNTDAEGRLVLADALSYAVKQYKPAAIIDVATLTGACAVALGPFYTAIMGKDDNLLNRVKDAAQKAGERVWELPFHDDYKKAISSDVADICNIGKRNYMAGAITAGFFLSHFVDDTPWVHMDIAGTAFNVPDTPYYDRGATGAAMRTLVALAMGWQ